MEKERKQDTSPPNLSASTPEGMENECILLAYNLVAERLRDGSATAAETVHFLKMGSAKERREQERLKQELELMEAKKEALQSAKHIEELYTNAMEAMRRYSGMGDDEEVED